MKLRNYINGEFVPPASGAYLDDIAPATGEVIAQIGHSAGDHRQAEAMAGEQPVEKASPPVKTVKVRSTIDVMAELEALRKKATSSSPKAKKDPTSSIGGIRGLGREIQKVINLAVPPETISRSRAMRVTVSFEDGDQVIQEQSERVELGDTGDVHSLSVNVRVDQS